MAGRVFIRDMMPPIADSVRPEPTGRRLDGKTYDEFPESAEVATLETEQRLLLLREVETEYRVGAGR